MLLGVAGLAGGMFWGSVSDRFGRERTLALTLFLAGIGAFLFGDRAGPARLALSAILFGSTGLSFPGLMGAACADRFGPKLASASLGLITILVGVGQAIGPLIGGAMNDAFSSLGALVHLLRGGVRGRRAGRAAPAPRRGARRRAIGSSCRSFPSGAAW